MFGKCKLSEEQQMEYENSPQYKIDLKNKYKALIQPGVRTNKDIIAILKERYKMIPCTKSDIIDSFWNLCVVENIRLEYHLEGKELKTQAFEIKFSLKSRKMFKVTKSYGVKDIKIVFEEKSQYFTSTSNPLEVECLVLQGISTKDYEDESMYFHSYMMTLEHYDNLFGEGKAIELLKQYT